MHWTTDGKKGGAYEFTTNGDQIVISNNDSLNPKQLTLAAWVKTTTKDPRWLRIFDKSYDTGYAMTLAGDWGKDSWRGQISMEAADPKGHFSTTGISVADGQWHQVVATIDGKGQRLYVDGKPQGRPVVFKGNVAANKYNLVIGCNQSDPPEELGQSFMGAIDEPMMWDRALSTNEIAFLYQSQQ